MNRNTTEKKTRCLQAKGNISFLKNDVFYLSNVGNINMKWTRTLRAPLKSYIVLRIIEMMHKKETNVIIIDQ